MTTISTYDESTSPGCNKLQMTLSGTDDLFRDMIAIQTTYEWSNITLKAVNDMTDGYRVDVT